MKLGKLLLSIVIVSLIVSMAIPMAAAPKPDKPPGGGKPQEPPADPAICYRRSNTLYVMNADGSNQVSIWENVGNPSWAPDGSAIAFLMQQEDYTYDLWRIDVSVVNGEPQGSNPAELTQDVPPQTPSWSSAGDVIGFLQNLEDGSKVIQTVPATGGPVETIYTAPEGYGMSDIAWNSDGTQIAINMGNDGLRSLVILEISDGTTTTVFGPTTYWFGHIDWARTSDTFVFESNDGIYILDITQPNPTPQMLIGSGHKMPSWSPDDTQIALLKWDKNNWLNLMVYDMATGEMVRLAKGFAPDWCRDIQP